MTTAPKDPLLRHVVGLDLGKLSDFSALALLEWRVPPPPEVEHSRDPRAAFLIRMTPPAPLVRHRPEYFVPVLKRWPLGTPYTDIAAHVIRFLKEPPQSSAIPLLAVDGTGVGIAVVELIYERLRLAAVAGGMVAVTITAGLAVSNPAAGVWHVAKARLVSTMRAVLGTKRLHVAPGQPEAGALVRELGAFQERKTQAANDVFEAREGEHDDLVLAVALAAWAAESLTWPPPPPPRPLRMIV